MKKTFLLIFLLAFINRHYAQEPQFSWVKALGSPNGDFGRSIKTDAAGNIYTTGCFHGTIDFDTDTSVYTLTTPTPTSREVYISKMSPDGALLWVKQLGAFFVSSMTLDAAGNVYTTGSFMGTVDFDPGPGVHNLTSFT
ncbi:MAG: SBBP repeat-containing protein, partial [Bacteroidota bacterium]|nr:SBBP repeat-containing protein [Bacteroidota bacterium]